MINNLSRKRKFRRSLFSVTSSKTNVFLETREQVFMFSLNNLPISVCAQHGKSSERTIEERDRTLVIYNVMRFVRKD